MKLKLVFLTLILALAFTACELFVPEEADVASINLSVDSENLAIGDTKAITLSVLPADADDNTVLWTSSDTAIATVSTDGVVKPIKPGIITITATSNDDSTKIGYQEIYVGYTETFDDPGNWTIESTAKSEKSVAAGKYSIKVFDSSSGGQVFYPTLVDGSIQVKMNGAYSLSVDMEANNNLETEGACTTPSVTFNYRWVSEEDFSFNKLYIANDGDFQISSYDKATDSWNYPVKWTKSSAINTDGSVNKIEIDQEKETMFLKINGTDIGSFSLGYVTGNSLFVLGNWDSYGTLEKVEIEATFDNLEIYPIAE